MDQFYFFLSLSSTTVWKIFLTRLLHSDQIPCFQVLKSYSSVFLFQTAKSHLCFPARVRPHSERLRMGRGVVCRSLPPPCSKFSLLCLLQWEKRNSRTGNGLDLPGAVVALFRLTLDHCHQDLVVGGPTLIHLWIFRKPQEGLHHWRVPEYGRFSPIQPTSSLPPTAPADGLFIVSILFLKFFSVTGSCLRWSDKKMALYHHLLKCYLTHGKHTYAHSNKRWKGQLSMAAP